MNRDELLSLGLDEAQADAVAQAFARLQELNAQLTAQLQAAKQTEVEKTELAAQLQRLQEQISLRDKRDAVLAQLSTLQCRDPQLVARLLDLDKITLGDDQLIGLAEQLQALKKRAPYLFLDSPDPAGGSAASGVGSIDFDMNTFLRGEN